MRGPEDFKHLSRSSFLFIQKELEVLQVPSPALGAEAVVCFSRHQFQLRLSQDKDKIIR